MTGLEVIKNANHKTSYFVEGSQPSKKVARQIRNTPQGHVACLLTTWRCGFYQPQGWSTCAAGPGGGQGEGTFSFLETSVHVQPL